MILRRIEHRAAFARSALAAHLLGLAAFAAWSCASKTPAGFTGDDGGPEAGGDDASPSSSGGSSSGSSSGLTLAESGTSSGGLGTGTCKDGMYAGTYECSFDFSSDGGPGSSEGGFNDAGFVVTGNLSFTLSQNTGSGESFIDTASGTFGGTCCLNLFTISSTLGGMLNCNTGTFTGSLTDGGYTGLGMMGMFNGPLSSGYDGTTFTFVNGTWNLYVPGAGNCIGDWTANYTGP